MFVVYQLLGLVASLHSADILHGDLKPDNVLLGATTAASPPAGDVGLDALTAHLVASPPTAGSHPLLDALPEEAACQALPLLVGGVDFGRSLDLKKGFSGELFAGDCHVQEFQPPCMAFSGRVPLCASCRAAAAVCPGCQQPVESARSNTETLWCHHIDLFGIAVIAHCILFGKYPRLARKPIGVVAPGDSPCTCPPLAFTFRGDWNGGTAGGMWATVLQELINWSPPRVEGALCGACVCRMQTALPEPRFGVVLLRRRSLDVLRDAQRAIENRMSNDRAAQVALLSELRSVADAI
eukprot:Polyplicarium_translucidae@DN4535_c0_g1_i1.p1